MFNVNDNIAGTHFCRRTAALCTHPSCVPLFVLLLPEAVQGIASGMGEVSRLYFVDEITSSINGQPANDYWAQVCTFCAT